MKEKFITRTMEVAIISASIFKEKEDGSITCEKQRDIIVPANLISDDENESNKFYALVADRLGSFSLKVEKIKVVTAKCSISMSEFLRHAKISFNEPEEQFETANQTEKLN